MRNVVYAILGAMESDRRPSDISAQFVLEFSAQLLRLRTYRASWDKYQTKSLYNPPAKVGPLSEARTRNISRACNIPNSDNSQ